MKNKLILPTILFTVILIASFFVISQENKNKISNQEDVLAENRGDLLATPIIFFYGDGCPHCAVVEKYFEENKIKEKIAFAQKEVYGNKQNAKELTEKAEICGLPTDSIGVPFLWDGEKCLIGDEDIIKFFQQKINN